MICDKKDLCGGCQYMGVPYPKQLEIKKKYVESLFPGQTVKSVVGMDDPYHYRCKVQAAVRQGAGGRLLYGNYAEKSHKLVLTPGCLINDDQINHLIADVIRLAERFKIPAFNEKTGEGILRHVLVRKGYATGQLLLVLVTGEGMFPGRNNFQKELRRQHPEITTIVQNFNGKFGSMVLGPRSNILYGRGFIEDKIDGKTFAISADSFYQVNPSQAEKLYRYAIQKAVGTKGKKKRLLDAYCGTGTIGILASTYFDRVLGVELNSHAVNDAKRNAKRNKAENCDFVCSDAGRYLMDMPADQVPDVVITDPPRSGCSREFLEALASASPRSIVYISCGPDTQARDCALLTAAGYQIKTIQPFDLFPFTQHVETVCLLTRKRDNIYIDVDVKKLGQDKLPFRATYKQIQDYVLDTYGLKVSSLNIAGVKDEMGIAKQFSYEDGGMSAGKRPRCPKEKHDAIVEAFQHFKMIE